MGEDSLRAVGELPRHGQHAIAPFVYVGADRDFFGCIRWLRLRLHWRLRVQREATVQIQSFACDGVRNRQLPRVQPQPLQTELFGPPAVERSLAVRGIANDWVGEMF